MFMLFAAVFIVVGLSALIIIHELGHFLAARYFGVLVEEFGFGIPPKMFGKRWGETLISLNWLPLGGFVRLYGERHDDEKSGIAPGRSFAHQNPFKKAMIIVAGVAMNFLLGWFLISLIFMIGIPQGVLVEQVKAGSLAESAGLKTGDQITGFKLTQDFVAFIEANKGKEINLAIQRGAEKIAIKVMPRIAVPAGEGNLGVAIVETGLPKTGFFRSFWEGFKTAFALTGAIFYSVGKLLAGIFTDPKILDSFIGPVGIVNTAIQTTKLGLAHFLQLLALISLNLAVFNILPIPALDGGRLLFILIEKIKGSAMNPNTEKIANGLGFAFLLLLIITVTVKDLLTLF